MLLIIHKLTQNIAKFEFAAAPTFWGSVDFLLEILETTAQPTHNIFF